MRVSWIARRFNHSILKEINPEYLLEGLMLKLQYFGHLMGRADSLKKTLMLGKIEGRRRRGQQRMRWLDGITDSTDMTLSRLWEIKAWQPTPVFLPGESHGQRRPAGCSPWGHKESDIAELVNTHTHPEKEVQ